MNSCDWLSEFEEKFKDDKEINTLKEDKFWGYIQINFRNGVVIDLAKHQTRQPPLNITK